LLGSVTHLGDKPHLDQLVGRCKVMLDAYAAGTLDRCFICYNRFVNTMTQEGACTSCCRCRPRKR
jgi:F-type H+-transporting ATPase subunit gamma